MNPPRRRYEAAPKSEPHLLFLGVLLVVVTLAAYGRVWGLGFTNFDDPPYVTENDQVLAGLGWSGIVWAFTTTTEANWHPLTWISLMLDATLGGADPRIYHATNLLLHVANTLLLFLLLSRMTGFRGRSAFVAALFAVHPLHVESVAWVAERKDVLSTLFWLLTIAAYVRYAARPSAWRYLAVFAPLALGLLAKPMLVTLPLVLLLLDYWPLRRWRATDAANAPRGLLLEKLPLFALATLSSVLTLLVQRPAMRVLEELPFGERAANALVSYAAYIGKTILPWRLAVFYPHEHGMLPWWKPAAAAALVAAVSVASILLARTRPWFLVGWFWFLLTLVPVLGLVQVGLQSMADRYTYVPLIGLFIVVAWGVPDLVLWFSGRARLPARVLAAAAAMIVLALAALTWVQVGFWRSGIDLFTHAIEVTEDNAFARYELSTAFEDLGDIDQAVVHLREALRITPLYPDAHYNLTHHLMRQGQIVEAAALCREQQATWPSDVRTLVDLGVLAVLQGRHDEAVHWFSEALRIDPNAVDARHNLEELRAAKDEEAIGQVSEALRKGGLARLLTTSRGGGSSGP